MSAQCQITAKRRVGAQLGIFERYLSLWVAFCIVIGITLGHFLSGVFQIIGGLEVAEVNLPVAILIWLMIVPMLLKIDFAALHQVREHWRGVVVTLFVNWAENHPDAYLALASVSKWDIEDRLDSIACPTCVISGEHDFMPLAMKEHYTAKLANGELKVIPGSGHFTPIDNPEKFNEAVMSFLAMHA